MNIFDKICAVLAFALGIVLLLLGALGLFTGCKANFTLPPILGVVPALVGWGILKPIWVAWKKPRGPLTGASDPRNMPCNTSWPVTQQDPDNSGPSL